MSEVKKITKINVGGTDYQIQDEGARTLISNLETSFASGTRILGIMTGDSGPSDKEEIKGNIEVGGKSWLTTGTGSNVIKDGDIVIYENKEFMIINKTWHELGDVSDISAFDSTSLSYPSTSHTHDITVNDHEVIKNGADVSITGTVTTDSTQSFVGVVPVPAYKMTGNTSFSSTPKYIKADLNQSGTISCVTDSNSGYMLEEDTDLFTATVNNDTLTLSSVTIKQYQQVTGSVANYTGVSLSKTTASTEGNGIVDVSTQFNADGLDIQANGTTNAYVTFRQPDANVQDDNTASKLAIPNSYTFSQNSGVVNADNNHKVTVSKVENQTGAPSANSNLDNIAIVKTTNS